MVEDELQLSMLLRDFSAIEGCKVLVHGGGRKATKMAERLGIETKMVEGRRITDADMLEVVTMVYGGLVNKNLVARLQANGVNALGLTGADANAIRSHKRPLKNGVDYGFGLKIVEIGKDGYTLDDILVHDAHCEDNTLQLKLALMGNGDGFPVALGVIRDVDAPTYDEAVSAQIAEVSAQKKYHNFAELLETNDTWEVK